MESPAHHPQKSFYWVDQGVSPPIEDQGKSNHCMIFASASALACSYYIKNRSNWIDFSVQQVLDNCAMEFKNPESRIKFFQYLNGGMDITTKDNYPSNIHNGCLVKQPFDSSKVKSPFVRAQWKKVNGLQNMMEAVKKNPLVGCICADDKIKQVLKDGRVYKNHVEGKRNHAILILGYGTSDEEGDFWYVQNSWGGIWGEGGIGKIARGVGMCKIEVSAYFPELIDTIETASKVEESVVRIGSHSVEDAAGAACGASLLMPFPQTSMAWKESRPVSDYSARSTGNEESLKFRLLGSDGDIGSWGHEYVRNLAGEIAHEYTKRQSGDGTIDDLMDPVQQIVAFHMQHIAEPEAVDLLMEGEDLDLLFEHVDRANYKRTCLYLTAAARYLPGPDDKLVLDIDEYASALQIALYLGNLQYVKQIFTTCNDLQCKKQFCYILARHAHLLDGRASAGSTVDSARQNLAATFVNAFLNAGFGQDKLTTLSSEATGGSASGNWLFKNKEHGKTSAAASLGMILQWDVDSGLAQIGKYFHSNNNHVIAGALLGVGIVNSSVKNDCDPALALLSDYVDKEDPSVRIGAIMGLGISYANTQNEMVRDKLKPILEDSEAPLDVVAFTAISLGLVYVGSCNEEVAQAIILSLMDRSESELGEPLSKFLPLGLGLLYLGRQENVEGTAEVSKTFNEKIRQHCDMTLLSCAYAGTGNVLKVQSLLGHCAQHLDKTETDQAPAVIGIAIIAMAEELGVEMAIRSLEHLLQYGEQNIRRAFPLALGLLCISNPKVNVMDTLSRLSHDSDSEVAMAAIISLGLIGAETNNARITGMFGNLSSYYYKDASSLSCVRIAQGLVHLGKGLLTLDPYHSDRFLLSPTALAGLPIMMRTCLDMKAVILGKYHYVLYFLVLAMQPRMLMTVDENLKPLSVPVRVGQAVDVVGQVGRPKTIAGFQTHSTPVLLAAGDRAELATEKYIPLSPIL